MKVRFPFMEGLAHSQLMILAWLIQQVLICKALSTVSQRERKREGGHELTTERMVLEEKGGIVFGPKPEQGVAVIAA